MTYCRHCRRDSFLGVEFLLALIAAVFLAVVTYQLGLEAAAASAAVTCATSTP